MLINSMDSGGMQYHALSLDELARMASTDQGARQYFLNNAQEIIEECNDRYDYTYEDDWYGDQCHEQGKGDRNKELAKKYAEQLLEWMLKVPDMVLAGDGDLDELETLLGALHAEIKDEEE